MIKGLYSVYDKMTGFMPPAAMENDEVAIRNFGYDVTSIDRNIINANPEDFNLQKIGTFDTELGEIAPIPIKIIADANQFMKKGTE